jgi:hypothetical protein
MLRPLFKPLARPLGVAPHSLITTGLVEYQLKIQKENFLQFLPLAKVSFDNPSTDPQLRIKVSYVYFEITISLNTHATNLKS